MTLVLYIARKIITEDEIYLRTEKTNIPSLKVMKNNGAYITHEDENYYLLRIKK